MWSVPALCAQGHEVMFSHSTVQIIFHVGVEHEFEVHLKNAHCVRKQGPLPFPSAHHVTKSENIKNAESITTKTNHKTNHKMNCETIHPNLSCKSQVTSPTNEMIMHTANLPANIDEDSIQDDFELASLASTSKPPDPLKRDDSLTSESDDEPPEPLREMILPHQNQMMIFLFL